MNASVRAATTEITGPDEAEHVRTLYRCHYEQMSSESSRGRPDSWLPWFLCEGVDPMGRGRAKAKQTKVARQLKYQTLDTNFDALQRELGGDGHSGGDGTHDEGDFDEYGSYSDPDGDEPRRQVG